MHRRTGILRLLPKRSIGAEIGVWKGEFASKILQIVKPKELYLIDPWEHMFQYPKRWYGKNTQERMDKIYEDVVKKLGNETHIIRDTSTNAALEFSNDFFNWVYIDGNHDYEYVKADILEYLPKVKVGGFICGHDYQMKSVRRAVEDVLSFTVGLVKKPRVGWQFVLQRTK